MIVQRAFHCGETHRLVTLERLSPGHYRGRVDGRPYVIEATRVAPSTLQLIIDGVVHTAHVARVGASDHVALDGEMYVLTAESPVDAAGSPRSVLAPPQITAPMPGKVLQVLVRPAGRVTAGDTLLILEAMKMEHRILAAAAATVRAVHVADGQNVDGGAVLIEVDYDETVTSPS